MRRIFVTVLVLVLLSFSTLPVSAATEGTVTGVFSTNVPPTITSVTFAPTSMTPQASQTITVPISDADNISDLNTVVFKLWLDNDGGAPIEGEFTAASASAANCAVITWTHTGGTTSTTVITPLTTTWTLGTCTVPTTNPNFNGTSFTFVFVLTVGKVATETSGSALWQIAVKATDDVNQTAWAYDAEGASMNWYGEISIPATTVTWAGLPPGTDFTAPAAQKTLGNTVTYIANGAYDEKVRATASWAGATYTATLDATGACSASQQFALKADDTATYASSVLVDATGVTIDDVGAQTTESGDAAANNNLWIKLSSTFNKDTYSGSIVYIVANGT